MIKIGSTLALLVLVSGCDAFRPPEIQDCEKRVLRELKAPSTYKLVEARSMFVSQEIVDKRPYKDIGVNIPHVSVSLEYDAQNSYGALIRGRSYCSYAPRDGEKADLNKLLELTI